MLFKWKKYFRVTVLLLYAVLFTSSILCSGKEKENTMYRIFQRIKERLERGRIKSAEARLKKIYKGRRYDTRIRNTAGVMLCNILNSQKKYEKAYEILSGIVSERPEDYYLVYGETLLGLKRYKEALDAASFYGEAHGEVIYCYAMFLNARANFHLEKYKECMEKCKEIISAVWVLLDKSEYRDDKGLKDLLGKADKLYKLALKKYEVQRYGMDYVLYKTAREYEFAGKYSKAVKYYAKISGGILKWAGICYSGHCFRKLGNPRKAVKTYDRLLSENPLALYYGEALYGKIVLTYLKGKKKDLKSAIKLCADLLEWIKDAEQFKGRIPLRGINTALKHDVIDTAPKEFLRLDDCGNLVRALRSPGTIENRLTSPWYMAYLKTKALLIAGFLNAEAGDYKASAEFFRRIENSESCSKPGLVLDRKYMTGFDPNTIGIFPLRRGPDAASASDCSWKKRKDAPLLSYAKLFRKEFTLKTLIYRAEIDSGAWVLSGKCRKKLNGREGAAVKLALFMYLAEQIDDAESLIAENVKKKRGANIYIVPAAKLCLALCRFEQGKISEALKLASRTALINAIRNTDIALKAKYLKACIWAGDRSKYKHAKDIFLELGETKDERIAPRALLSLAVAAVNQKDIAGAKKACKLLFRHFAGTCWADAGKTLLKAVKHGIIPGKKIKPYETFSGKVIVNRKNVVIPGNTDWDIDMSEDIGPGDVILYAVKCIPRDDCTIITGLKMRLTPGEPQLPVFKGNTLCFARVPILFNEPLVYQDMQSKGH